MALDAQERSALAEAVRDASASGPRDHLDDHGKPRRDERLWKLLVDQMGLGGLVVAEGSESDEDSAGIAEMALVCEELARNLAVVPALSTLGMAGSLLRVVATGEAEALLSRAAANEVAIAVGWPDAGSTRVVAALTGSGRTDPGSTITVDGQVDFVLDGSDTDVLLVPVRVGDTEVVVAVDTGAQGLAVTAMTGLDLTRGLASFAFTGCPATVVGPASNLASALDISLILIAAEQIGVAQHCHDAAVAWAKERIQFDRPIGQFQAIKHQLVDLLMKLELGRSALDVAVAAADAHLESPDEETARALSVAASTAKAACGDAAVIIADQSLHILGGIGFTWEHDAHLYLRRAKVLEVYLGTPGAHRARFATRLLEDASR
ncbi:acyl-CoA dehydrogenase [Gordonia jinghuaiqii]|uniref:Acyl-CoA/acyl-ACP dehydrogenase n=1 Tax=Gordonia jinghuaiqii TaxID=2758710 RepID=A0A7D7LZH7_9ACTN|nr:acyl-CoA dehydrogenase family protein [Gordonia jinghuaiqii]MCR5980599.1 acyl-CoA dehydrogenase [Gordonia jinghuaiqii]QMT02656.1 acyl-CoA/acyl-ACP dehydrogenase [Gordonia jinghuaiqii]